MIQRPPRVSALLVLLSACLCLVSSVRAGEGDDWVGKPAPSFELVDLEGNELRLADFAGKKVVWLNFWGVRCGPCIQELPSLQTLYAENREKGLLVIGVNADTLEADFLRKAFAESEALKAAKITFPITPDPTFKVLDAYGLMGAPLNVMIDKAGIVRYRHEGYEEGDELQYAEELKKLLSQ